MRGCGLSYTRQQFEQTLASCDAAETRSVWRRDGWRKEYRERVDACAATLPCDRQFDPDGRFQLADECWPVALAELADSLLDDALVDACVLVDTADCESAVRNATSLPSNVITHCAQRWVECGPGKNLVRDREPARLWPLARDAQRRGRSLSSAAAPRTE
jgi:hypothetical protein